MEQALEVWSHLEQAYHGVHPYGSNTAEVYVYHFMSGAPRPLNMLESPGIMGELVRESYDTANHAMHDLFVLFGKNRDAQIEVEGKELGEWVKTARFCHRVHVKVTPRKGR
jgi:hypothetical protein